MTTLEAAQQAWEKDATHVEVIDVYEAEIVGEEGDLFLIEFFDEEGRVVEAKLRKADFTHHPRSVSVGTFFGIVLHRGRGEPAVTVSAWPIEEHWNRSLLER